MSAFSEENFHKDSTMFSDSEVEHLTSWLSINPVKGCSLACAYCFRYKWHSSATPKEVSNLENSVDKLMNHELFENGKTPISINNSSTDPLLPYTKKTTFDAIRILEKRKVRNPFIIISKLGLTQTDITFFESLKYVKPILFVSLALIPEYIEPVPIKPRLRNLELLKKSGVPVIHYFRPIVPGWNDSLEKIQLALQIGDKYADAICIGGLRMSPEIRKELVRNQVDVSEFPDDFHNKIMNKDLENKVLTVYSKLGLTVPLFKHSSCAVSYIQRIPNYNLLFKNPQKNCVSSCPASQNKICNANG